ncbi:hypothetical protein ACFYUJ_39125 [Streptomyces sp. NPDC004520]|uniref:hypothetical protein n=1 Tax=Streptomyces sp. NPDC004520 TaxID=3364702 RepID=UPI0036A6D86F
MAKKLEPIAWPERARLVVPVLGAVGGSGRSTVAGLLAGAAADVGLCPVVLDTCARLSSPWPRWAGEPGGGLRTVPAESPSTQSRVQAAASLCLSAGSRSWHVLTDHQDWSAPPLVLPEDPWAWYQLTAIGGWELVVADTARPAADDVVRSRSEGRTSVTAGWCGLPYAVPLLVADASADGMHALEGVVMAAVAEGLPLGRTVVVVVRSSDRSVPAAVKAATTMLAPRVSALLEVPFDGGLRALGLTAPERLRSRTWRAAGQLLQAVLDSASSVWGDPLPAAPAPAPLEPLSTLTISEEVPSCV